MTSPGTEAKQEPASAQGVGRLSGHRLRVPRRLVFFAFFYIYFALEIDVRLLYHCCGLIDNFPRFYWGWDFFRSFPTYPGGMVAYLSSLLAQSFYSAWLGAAVITAQAWAICWCTDRILKAFGARQWRALRFFGPLLLLAVYSQYGSHFPTTVAFLIALLGVCIYLQWAPPNVRSAAVFYLTVSVVLYVIVGGPYLLFVVLCTLHELLSHRRPGLALIQLAAGAGLPYILGVALYRVRVHDAYLELLPWSWKVAYRDSSAIMLNATYVLYLSMPFAAGVLGLWNLVSEKRNPYRTAHRRQAKRAKASAQPNAVRVAITKLIQDPGHRGIGLNLQTFVLIAATAITLLLYRDTNQRRIFRVDYFCRQHQWEQVLDIGRQSPYHYLTCHAVNRALFHTGQLGDRMFHFPQRPEALFLTRKGAEALWQKVDTCMDIGLLNQAENAASICVETFGEHPLLLQRLATINIAKNNPSTARVFLHALEKVPFWRATARDALTQLAKDPNGAEDPEIQQLRSVMLKTDFVRDADTLTLLLTENPANRMAFEYGVSSLLLSKNLDDFVKIFATYHHHNARRLPRHHAEALLLYQALKKQSLDIPGLTIDREIKLQLHDFLQALQQSGKDRSTTKEKLKATLKGQYGNTYFYYFFLGS